jgi:hypothetical protein
VSQLGSAHRHRGRAVSRNDRIQPMGLLWATAARLSYLHMPEFHFNLAGEAGGVSLRVECHQVWRVIWPGECFDQLFGRTSTCLESHAEQWNLSFTSGNDVIGL